MTRPAYPTLLTTFAPCLLALAAPLCLASDYHVATSGADSASGDAAAPFRTIARALQAAQPGDAIVLHSGVYCESVRIRVPNITLKSADGEWAVIKAPIGTHDDPQLCVMFDVDAHFGTLQRLELIGGYYTVFLQSRWDWGGPDNRGASDILIEDCRIHESGRDCIKLAPQCDRVTIRRCEIFNSGRIYPPGTSLDDKNAEGIDNVNSDFTLVQDCYVHDTATTGVYFKGGASDCVIERTRVERCGQGGVLVGFDTSPEFFDTGANPRYFESIRCTVRNCIIQDTDYAGLGFYAASDALAVNNTIVNTARVGHSPVYFGVTLQDWEPSAGRPASANVRVINNIVAQLQPSDAPLVFIRFLDELGGLSGVEGMPSMSNNLYFNAAGEPRFGDDRPGSMLDGANLAGWQAHISGDAGSFVANPLLGPDLHLLSGSPAIGVGAPGGPADDFDAEARGGSIDIGADQFGANPTKASAFGSISAEAVAASGCGGGDVFNTGGESGGSASGNTATGGGSGGAGGANGSAGEDGPPDLSAGLCPGAALASLSLSLLGLRRPRR